MIDQDIVSKDMSPYSVLFSTMMLCASIGGVYIYNLIKKSDELEKIVSETAAIQAAHVSVFEEHDQRIREKKDYDESDEIEEDAYQGWSGRYNYMNDLKITITLWREKLSTIKKNQEWKAWDGERDGSCIVRDFYLGNSNPDFQWKAVIFEAIYSGLATETMVNGWDSVVKLEILVCGPSRESFIRYTKGNEEKSHNELFNSFLKKAIDENLIEWKRVVIPC